MRPEDGQVAFFLPFDDFKPPALPPTWTGIGTTAVVASTSSRPGTTASGTGLTRRGYRQPALFRPHTRQFITNQHSSKQPRINQPDTQHRAPNQRPAQRDEDEQVTPVSSRKSTLSARSATEPAAVATRNSTKK